MYFSFHHLALKKTVFYLFGKQLSNSFRLHRGLFLLPFLTIMGLGFLSVGFAQSGKDKLSNADSLNKNQLGSLVGVLISGEKEEPINGATIRLISQSDSSIRLQRLTQGNGKFQFQEVAYGKWWIDISHVGHGSNRTPLLIQSLETDLDTLVLMPSSAVLEEVIVSFKRPPLVVKEDTLEYNADSFKTLPEATTEELLRKIPGLDVDRDGNITTQGEPITQILVDGKPFFGGDLKLATQNLPADIIDKIQVIDQKSDRARFTKIDDGQRTKVINITIKKNKKRGYFGRVSGGLGTDDRYNSELFVNRFKDTKQYSVFGSSNNINSSGRGGAPDNQSGVNTFHRFGGNFRNTYDKKLDVAISANGNMNEQLSLASIERQNLQTGAVPFNNETQIGNSRNNTYRANGDLIYKPDSLTEITLRFSGNYNDRKSEQRNRFEFLNEQEDTLTSGFRNNFGKGNGTQGNASLNVMRKFSKIGRFLTFDFGNSINRNFNESILQFRNEGVDRFGNTFLTENDQMTIQKSNATSYNLGLFYAEPIFKNHLIEVNYGLSGRRNTSDRETYDWANGKYEDLNDSLSNRFLNTSISHRAGLKWVGYGKNFNYNAGARLESLNQVNNNISKNNIVNRDFTNITPEAALTFFNKNGRNIQLFYEGRVNQPSLQQLQPVPNNFDPLFQYSGNPDLKNEFVHSVRYRYQDFFKNKTIGFNINGNYTRTNNRIINNTYIDDAGVRYTRPENVNGVWQLNGNTGFNLPIIEKTLRFNMDVGTRYGNGKSFIRNQENTTKQFNLNVGGKIIFDVAEVLNLSYQVRWARNDVKYSLQPSLNNVFYSANQQFDLQVEIPGGFQLKSSYDLQTYRGNTNSFNQQISLWNASLSKTFLKRRLFLTASSFDLLRQNRSIFRRVTDEAIIDEVRNTPTQYFMLSITYRLNKFGNRGGERRIRPNMGTEISPGVYRVIE